MPLPANSYDPELLLLIEPWVKNRECAIEGLIAADKAQELGLTNCEWALRHLIEDGTRELLFTGSRCYGTPGPQSDFDFVMRVSAVSRFPFEVSADEINKGRGSYERRYFESSTPEIVNPLLDCSLRFGPINLICVSSNAQWIAWQEGTEELLIQSESYGPRTRAQAVAKFEEKQLRYLVVDRDESFV